METIVRAGGNTLTLLGAPRIFPILRSLTDGRKGQLDLRRDAGSPAQSTLRGHLRTLEGIDLIARERRDIFPGALEYELTESGQELFSTAETVGRWLAEAPSGPLALGSEPARAAIKGLVDGWTTSLLSALASDPLSLTELDKRVSTASYPAIDRCLQTMRLAKQLEVGKRGSKGTPYALTNWIRRGLTPLTAAARWEHRWQPQDVDPVGRADINDAFLLGAPLLKLSEATNGVCQFGVRIPNGKRYTRALAYVEVQDGELRFGGPYPQVKPDAWASGTAETWFAAALDADRTGLRLSGDRDLAEEILDGVHRALSQAATSSPGK